MKFLVDRCAGKHLSVWLRQNGFDVLDAKEIGVDPGDAAILERAADEDRVLVTIDTDFGELVFLREMRHAGLVRLPDVPAERRISLMAQLIERFPEALEQGGIITVRGSRIRVSRFPASH
ncbi:MAG: DUF5615 family PIN-like protein [Gammaproteobacteria bacterium]|nr:DUF5615 family PIN-like protein [Gammaproteobacteria bacterium]MCY4199907.1 DUF5615 family PIN-like protein [Gammaproteobacteria bacterium]